MKVAIVKERQAHERRSTPDTVKRLVGMGLKVVVESGAGGAASFTDEAYQAAGGSIAADAATALARPTSCSRCGGRCAAVTPARTNSP
jgi:NAD(P) transhydrogenase subunit alpha